MDNAEILGRAQELLYAVCGENMSKEREQQYHDVIRRLKALAARLPELERDAARYRGLVEHYSQSYSMGIDCPAEHGIWWDWQQGTPEEQHTTLAQALDADLAQIKEKPHA